MSVLDWSVIAGGVVLTAVLVWYCFGPKKSRRADVADGVQAATAPTSSRSKPGCRCGCCSTGKKAGTAPPG